MHECDLLQWWCKIRLSEWVYSEHYCRQDSEHAVSDNRDGWSLHWDVWSEQQQLGNLCGRDSEGAAHSKLWFDKQLWNLRGRFIHEHDGSEHLCDVSDWKLLHWWQQRDGMWYRHVSYGDGRHSSEQLYSVFNELSH